MREVSALEQAIRLLLLPSAVRAMQEAPLPGDVEFLFRILAREPDAESRAVALSNKSIEKIRQAAEFYVCQIVLTPSASPRRVLGAEQGGSRQAMRQNMALLLRWLHPDHDFGVENRQALFDRVVRAWTLVRTQTDPVQQRPDRQMARVFRYGPVSAPPYARAPHFGTARSAADAGRSRKSRRRRAVLGVALIALFATVAIAAHQDLLTTLLDIDWRALASL